MSRSPSKIATAIYGLLFPAILVFAAHFFFISNYTSNWSVVLFADKYTQSIYRYRILARELVLLLANSAPFPSTTFFGVGEHYQPFEARLYWAFFIVNSIFWVLSCLTIWLYLRRLLPDPKQVRVAYLPVVLVGFLAMFVVVPYDTMGYFFLTVSIILVHSEKWYSVQLLTLVSVLGTLTRETQFLVLPYVFVVMLYRGVDREMVKKFGSLLATTFGLYAALRVILGMELGKETVSVANSPELVGGVVVSAFTLFDNVTRPVQLLGILMILVFTWIVVDIAPKRENFTYRPFTFFVLACSPYLLLLLVATHIVEIRAVVPLWIDLTLLHAWFYAVDDNELAPVAKRALNWMNISY